MKVLMAEDGQEMRCWLAELVRNKGHQPLQAANGQEALDLLVQHLDVGLIVLDLVMPVKTGLDFLVEARAAGLLKAPVYVLSGYDPAWASASGIAGFLPKPVLKEEFESVLEAAALTQPALK